MRIERSHFGHTPPGHPVTRFTLHNDRGTRVSIITLGAAVQSIVVPDREGGFDDIVLGYNDTEGYWHDTHYMGAVIGRYANRIARGRFTLDGISYALSRNLGTHHLHGGRIGFDKRLWNAAPAQSGDRIGLTLKRVSEHGEEGYPGNLSVTVHYSLNNANELRIQYRAETDQATPVNLTHHGYFNLSGNHNTAIDSHVVWINADYFLPVDADCIPTGEIAPVSETPLDFRQPTAIKERINGGHMQLERVGGYDHNWVLNACDGRIKRQASVYHKDSGRLLEVCTSEPGLQFYSGNSLHSRLPGKSNHPYRCRQGLCLETQHFPNSPNQPEFPATILRPGQTFRSETVYRFMLKSDQH
jgi:aldose 1-epimerase